MKSMKVQSLGVEIEVKSNTGFTELNISQHSFQKGSVDYHHDENGDITVQIHDKIRQTIEDNKDCKKKNVTEVVTELGTSPEGVKEDVVAIYDNSGIPSFMRRFTFTRNSELFEGGSTEPHSAFVIDGVDYDEIFISVYPNCNINGKPYSLPGMKPWTNITIEDAERACFSKGDGWHLMTAAEWGLIANICHKSGVFPHGNTNYGQYHGDATEKGIPIEDGSPITLTGTGPKTWTHDHTVTGVHDLCGNVYEFVRGLRFKDGAIEYIKDNDAALDIDLSENSKNWKRMKDPEDDKVIYVNAAGGVHFTKEKPKKNLWNSCRWKDVDCEFPYTEQMKELAIYPGEPETYCGIDSSEGERLAYRGGYWFYSSDYGVFCLYGVNPRSGSSNSIGFRSAYFKRKTVN